MSSPAKGTVDSSRKHGCGVRTTADLGMDSQAQVRKSPLKGP